MYSLIKNKIEEANNRFLLFEGCDKVLVALSGGADSVALLLSLKEFYPELSLYACHVNHMLRGDESDRDMEFVKELCDKYGITLELLKTDVGSHAKESGLSTELAARNIRYGFFEDICKKYGINKIATAHTLSDSAETVLFNLTRGTGLSGLCGIPAKRALNDEINVVRPLIFVKRSEIEAYLEDKKQTYVTDSTNLTDDYTRNYFRHRIIPLLKNINPSFEDNLKNTCNSLNLTQIFVEKTVNNSVTDSINELALLDSCILSQVIIKLYFASTGKTLLESVHINAVVSLIKNYASGKSQANEVCLPGKMSAIIKDGKLVFTQTLRNKHENTASYSMRLEYGINYIENSGFAIALTHEAAPDIPEGFRLYCRYAADESNLSGVLYARNRRDGDTMKCCGMTKKVKALFTQCKTPLNIRNRIPFICDDTGILAIPKVSHSDRIDENNTSENNKLYIYIYSKTTL